MKKYLPCTLISVLIVIIASCAKIGSPSGGPKDEDIPVAKKAKPANYSTHYNRKKVIIYFDEYIKLDNQFNEFTISPPLEKKPIPLTKGKNIVVEVPSSMLDSATYSLDFGQSIKDNNEGNLLKSFKFVFSTQSFIDSFSVRGKVLDAFNSKPDKDRIFVYLHNNLNDSAPYTVIPSYLGRTNPEGKYQINHVAPGTYSVIAVKDMNNNMLFDMPTEAVAFSDHLLYLYADSFKNKMPLIDTADIINTAIDQKKSKSDSSINKISSIKISSADSAAKSDSLRLIAYGYNFDMFSFLEEDKSQYLIDFSREGSEKIKFIFNKPLEELMPIRLLNPVTQKKWFYLESDKTLDTLVLWLADSNLVATDSLVAEIMYPYTDTTGTLVTKTDTLKFIVVQKEKKDSKSGSGKSGTGRMSRKDKKAENADTLKSKIPTLSFETNINKSAHDLNLPILITTGAPVFNFNKDFYRLFKYNDTVLVPVKPVFQSDSSNFRRFKLTLEYEPLTKYKLDLFPGLLTDIYTRTIDTASFTFTTQRDDYYGSVTVKFEGVKKPILVQILGKDEKVLSQKAINSSQKVTFEYLKPGKYSLKIIADDNNNGKWDTGNLEQKLQPEKVDYFPTELDVRSNWEVENTWEVKW